MLDVHPPHQAAHSWKDFLIHIVTIVIGLLIAIGLEQSVEWMHHRNELREARRALDLERKLNSATSVSRTKEWLRVKGKLQTDLAVFEYLGEHPGAPASQWPAKLSWTNLSLGFNDPAWQVATKNNVVAYMPHAELQQDTELYGRLNESNAAGIAFIAKVREVTSYAIRQPDASRLSPLQVEHTAELISQSLFLLAMDGTALVNLSERFPEFSSPSRQAISELRRAPSPPEDVKETLGIQSERHRLADEIEKAHTE